MNEVYIKLMEIQQSDYLSKLYFQSKKIEHSGLTEIAACVDAI